MEKSIKSDRLFTAKPISLYNHVEEVYERVESNDVKIDKGQRVIPVVSFKRKIGFRIICKKTKYTFLKLHIKETDATIKVNIRNFLEMKYKGREINKSLLAGVIHKLAKEVIVKRVDGVWTIVNYDTLLIK